MSIRVNELLEIGRRYNDIDAQIKALEKEKEKERLKAVIVANIGRGNSRTVDNQLTFKVNHIESIRFNETELKEVEPETYKRFKNKLVVSDRVSVKEVKEVRQ